VTGTPLPAPYDLMIWANITVSNWIAIGRIKARVEASKADNKKTPR